MKKKTLLVALLVLLSGLAFASDEVSIVVSSDGATKDEAIKMALRSAIEQTFGAFVSSNTTVLNDQLVNDEIVSLSNAELMSYVNQGKKVESLFNTSIWDRAMSQIEDRK